MVIIVLEKKSDLAKVTQLANGRSKTYTDVNAKPILLTTVFNAFQII